MKAVLVRTGIGFVEFWCAIILVACESAYHGGLPPADSSTGYGITGYVSQSAGKVGTNGHYSTGSRSEGYSSGSGGTYASQGDSGSDGRWQVHNDQLFISEGKK